MGLTSASCTASCTMNGVAMPVLSAGSNQAGAMVTCMA
jgi:hypothetical protein